jgi:hypothetical protein
MSASFLNGYEITNSLIESRQYRQVGFSVATMAARSFVPTNVWSAD